jgi:hypothetical protein
MEDLLTLALLLKALKFSNASRLGLLLNRSTILAWAGVNFPIARIRENKSGFVFNLLFKKYKYFEHSFHSLVYLSR